MKKKGVLVLILAGMIFTAGCGLAGEGKNTKAALEQVKALDYEGALENFALAEEAGESKRELYRGEGIAYLGQMGYEDAVEAFEKALSCSNGIVDDMDIDINYYLATAYYKQGDLDQAIGVYNAITGMKKDAVDAYYLRAVLETEQGKMDEALADFEKTIALDARDYDRLIDIYCVLQEKGYGESGAAYLQRAMESETRYMTNYEKGRISYYMGDYENARTYLDKAKSENGSEAVLFLGRTHEELGDYNYAVSVYNTYLTEGGEKSPQLLNQMGLCKMQMNDYEGALAAFQEAMNQEDDSLLQTLKMNEITAYEHLGEYKQAAVLLSSYLKTYPDDEKAAREYEFLKTR